MGKMGEMGEMGEIGELTQHLVRVGLCTNVIINSEQKISKPAPTQSKFTPPPNQSQDLWVQCEWD